MDTSAQSTYFATGAQLKDLDIFGISDLSALSGTVLVIILLAGLLASSALIVDSATQSEGEKFAFFHHADRKHLKQITLPNDAVTVKDSGRRKTNGNIVNLLTKVTAAVDEHNWDELTLKPAAKEKLGKRRPLLVFVNSSSGGQQGTEVLREMRGRLHWVQVVDLHKEKGPEQALRWWDNTGQHYRVLVCGGDGTVGWILGTIEKLQLQNPPAVAILPLGTGNDLARVLGWGGGFHGGSVMPVLKGVSDAHAALLDKWEVKCQDQQVELVRRRRTSWLPRLRTKTLFKTAVEEEDEVEKSDSQAQKKHRKSVVMCNYFDIGVGAGVTLDFHNLRERRPYLFFSRIVNYLWYAHSGLVNSLYKVGKDLNQKIVLECDGKVVTLPEGLEGVVVLNINSFGGGTDLWGAADAPNEADSDSDSGSEAAEAKDEGEEDEEEDLSEDEKTRRRTLQGRPSMHDRKLEVVGVHGSLQIGATYLGLYKAVKLYQAKKVVIRNKVDLPVQVDGEPWMFAKNGEIAIEFKSQAYMLQKSKASSHVVATDIIDWAKTSDVITTAQWSKMTEELARRAHLSRTSLSTGNLVGMVSSKF